MVCRFQNPRASLNKSKSRVLSCKEITKLETAAAFFDQEFVADLAHPRKSAERT